MSKFLKIVEGNLPESDIDALTSAKRELQRLLMSKGIKANAKTFRDTITITVGDKAVELELKNVKSITSEEDAEDPSATINSITAIAGLPDQGIKGLLTPTGRKLSKAKHTMADAAVKIADKFNKAASSQ